MSPHRDEDPEVVGARQQIARGMQPSERLVARERPDLGPRPMALRAAVLLASIKTTIFVVSGLPAILAALYWCLMSLEFLWLGAALAALGCAVAYIWATFGVWDGGSAAFRVLALFLFCSAALGLVGLLRGRGGLVLTWTLVDCASFALLFHPSVARFVEAASCRRRAQAAKAD